MWNVRDDGYFIFVYFLIIVIIWIIFDVNLRVLYNILDVILYIRIILSIIKYIQDIQK